MYADAWFGFGGYLPGFWPEFSPPPMIFSSLLSSSVSVTADVAGPQYSPEFRQAGGVGEELLTAGFSSELSPEIGVHLGNMVQTSIISEYDLGGEGDLFKAPEPIIQEPVLGLDPMAAAMSMISSSDDVITQNMKVADIESIQNLITETMTAADIGMQNDPLLSEVFYECKKDLLEKTTIGESLSELLDIKIPLVQVDEVPAQVEAEVPSEEKQKSVVEGPLQKSISFECLNSMEWIQGCSVRPNFLDFQGLDFEAAFGMRRAYSEGDIQDLGTSNSRPPNTTNVNSSPEQLLMMSDLKTEERRQKLSRYRRKKVKRNFGRKIKYACRKALADSQPRVRGRFAKIECEMFKPRK